ncbi:MAG: McrB family protein [Acidaminococcaceae bacterium]
MINYDFAEMFKSIKKLDEVTDEFFKIILEQCDLTEDSYEQLLSGSEEIAKKLNKKIFQKEGKHYFTIASENDFISLEQTDSNSPFEYTMIYHPLNNHSRGELFLGDILFCYRTGQFSSLSEALETRGIYGIGVAASNPIRFFPDKIKEHEQYGVVVVFPFLLKIHLSVKNIQLCPNTIDLTPYNGNRNDSLQYIGNSIHYNSLMSLVVAQNPILKEDISKILNLAIADIQLPTKIWESQGATPPALNQEELKFDIDKFVDDLRKSGLVYSKALITRFVTSLMTKPFLIFTGLSGSGKTQLAVSFAKWLIGYNSLYSLLNNALATEEFQSKYKLEHDAGDYIEVINTNGQSQKLIPLPKELIFEWYDAYKKGLISEESDPKSARKALYETSKYQKYMHGFYNDLSKIARIMFSLSNEDKQKRLEQYRIIPVGADWINRDPLLGYTNALNNKQYVKPESGALDIIINAVENPDLPFFIILDEMNLSYVERYFADFLSAMESKDKISLHNIQNEEKGIPATIKYPSNLFIIGTVNIDETTYMFSPKVLDRANTIDFRISERELRKYIENPNHLEFFNIEGMGSTMSNVFMKMSKEKMISQETRDNYTEELVLFFNQLKPIGAEFGYRSLNEMFVLIQNLGRTDVSLLKEQKLDIAVVQKLIPKIHGSRRKVCPILLVLAKMCINDSAMKIEKDIFNNESFDFESDIVKYPLTLKKICRMYNTAIDTGFTSFAEA